MIVVTLAVVGVAMLVADRLGRRQRKAEDLTWGEAFALGIAQSLALIPGVSRSGATITTGLAFGLERESAARFSFLLGVPAMFAAAAHEGHRMLGVPMDAVTSRCSSSASCRRPSSATRRSSISCGISLGHA